MDRPRQITYDDILSSLNMVVVDGKLVINRNIEKEKQKANITITTPQNKLLLSTPPQQQAPPQPEINSLERLQESLKRKKEKKKMFILDEMKPSSHQSHLKTMLI